MARRSRGARRWRRRLNRSFNPVRGLSKRQRASVAVLLLALIAGIAALVILLSPPGSRSGGAGDSLLPPLTNIAPAGGGDGGPTTLGLDVPAVDIHLRVAEGDGIHVPLNLALHYPKTAAPGQAGNSVYYAHAQPGMFQNLFHVHLGDEILVLRSDGTEVSYHINATRKVAWNDVSVLRPTAFPEITLITCTSYAPRDPRLIVTGTQGTP